MTKANVDYVIRKSDGKLLGEFLSLDGRVQPRQYKQHNILMCIQVPNELYLKALEYVNQHGNIIYIRKGNHINTTIYYLGCPNQVTKSSLINWFGTLDKVHAVTLYSIDTVTREKMGLK
jgi:hypothetical protein